MIVSSFSEKGYEQYGKDFIKGFLSRWPDETLVLYCESPIEVKDKRVITRDLLKVPGAEELLRKLYNSEEIFKGIRCSVEKPEQKMYDYRYDAYRFCRKVLAITHAASLRENDDKFAWLDADVKFHETIPPDFLNSVIADDVMISYLGRPWAYTETGFIGFNPKVLGFDRFIEMYLACYSTGAFRWLGQWHDCYVFDMVRTLLSIPGEDMAKGFNIEHPFINTVLGEYMDHLKGPERKKVGRSALHEHVGVRKPKHWLKEGDQVQGISHKDNEENVA